MATCFPAPNLGCWWGRVYIVLIHMSACFWRRPRRGRSKRRRRRTNPCAWVLSSLGWPFVREANNCLWLDLRMIFQYLKPRIPRVLLFVLAFGSLLSEGGKTPVKQSQTNRRKRQLAIFQGRRWSIVDGPSMLDDGSFLSVFSCLILWCQFFLWKWSGRPEPVFSIQIGFPWILR